MYTKQKTLNDCFFSWYLMCIMCQLFSSMTKHKVYKVSYNMIDIYCHSFISEIFHDHHQHNPAFENRFSVHFWCNLRIIQIIFILQSIFSRFLYKKNIQVQIIFHSTSIHEFNIETSPRLLINLSTKTFEQVFISVFSVFARLQHCLRCVSLNVTLIAWWSWAKAFTTKLLDLQWLLINGGIYNCIELKLIVMK